MYLPSFVNGDSHEILRLQWNRKYRTNRAAAKGFSEAVQGVIPLEREDIFVRAGFRSTYLKGEIFC